MIPIAMLLPWRQVFYAIAPIGFAVSAIMQLLELLANKRRGVVELRFLGVYAILAGCWIIFGVAVHGWAVWAPQVVLGFTFLATIIAWHKAR